ncbi:MAG: glycosyltransferase family 4 protein [Fuerstiella sp.]
MSLARRTRRLLSGSPSVTRQYQHLVDSLQDPPEPEYDLVYVLPPKHVQGWILDAICREIDAHTDGRTAFVEFKTPVPPARACFYSHYGYFRDTLLLQPSVLHSRNLLFYTHPRDLWYSHAELIHVMNLADSVISMCSQFARDLVTQGVAEQLIEVGLVGADPEIFQPHARGTGRVGFCSSWLPRKGGDRMLEIIRALPDRPFVLCGKKWEQWSRFDELMALPNFEYVQLPYSEYPSFYHSIDVFVSVSELEGGPVPLIEAAMCNVVPVCSDTGHAPDIITHGKNGYLFGPSNSVAEICDLVEQACAARFDVRHTVDHLSWQRFSQQVQQLAGVSEPEPACPAVASDAA